MAAEPALDGVGDAIDRLLRKFRARDEVSDVEERALESAFSGFREVGQSRVITRAGEPLTESLLLVEGIVARYRDLADGQRQILELHVPGDFLDLHGFLLKRLDHNIGAVTRVRLATFPHDRLREITEEHPHLARLLWFSTLLDAAIHRERLLSVGRRSALSRIAHLLCELYRRLEVVGLASDDRFPLPLTQADIADANGLTSVHVNRMLRRLRDDRIATFRGGEVVIHDMAQLESIAEFNNSYLYLWRQPR